MLNPIARPDQPGPYTPGPVTILSMGDSLTLGTGGTANLGGYRGKLIEILTAEGYTVTLTGSLTTNGSAITPANPRHEGHGGIQIRNLEPFLPAESEPDIVLLMAGINNFADASREPAEVIDELEQLIRDIHTNHSGTHVVVSNLTYWTDTRNENVRTLYNPLIPPLAASLTAEGLSTSSVDNRSVVLPENLTDGVHPDQTGFDAMAAVWAAAVREYAPVP